MANLLASLISSADTLQAYGSVLETAQNNVSNASTPGYAKQRTSLYALPFDPEGGATGGVRAGDLQSSRNEYAEQAVRQQNTGMGYEQQMVDSLTPLQSQFDVSGNQGIPAALNNLFQSFSAWATTPNNDASRQTVLDRAGQVASAFQQTANAIGAQATNAEQQIRQTVDQVNQLTSQLANYNQIALQGNKDDAGLSAQVHATLEQLSQYVDITTSFQDDGSVSVLMNGETPLVIEDKQYQISAGLYQPQDPPPIYPNSPASMQVLSSDGSDITAKTTGGQLGALLEVRNQSLASLIGDAYQPGDLNTMAKQFADRVNQVLTAGNISDGPPAVSGVPLFTYDTTNDTAVAQSLSVDPSVTTDQLATIDPGPPYVSNGVPLDLSQLATPVQDADKINGVSYNQYYGQLAGRVGSQLDDATNRQQVQQSLLAQAKELRDQYSGVSLDEEATILIQFQRAYQANSRFITVLDQLTQSTIDILQP
ncbi:MAG TPA: flagellar hook-associated protein FlgK [Verrucomicrobiae bacterium]|nr:flagellar hook-associated protein FlgK [Verrucomicrobiae bacterium]